MSAPNLTITPGGTAKRSYRLVTRPRGNHTMSGTVKTMGSKPDEDPALDYDESFEERRRNRLNDEGVYALVGKRLEWVFAPRLERAKARVNRTKRPERKAAAQRELDALQCEHDAALEALPERSPGWRVGWSRERGVRASPPRESEYFAHGPDAEVLEMTTSDGYTLVRAVVAGDPKLASRVCHALTEILAVIDPACEDDKRPLSLVT